MFLYRGRCVRMADQSHPPIAYSISDAAKASSLSQATLYAMMASGKLRFSKVGRRRLIPASALLEL